MTLAALWATSCFDARACAMCRPSSCISSSLSCSSRPCTLARGCFFLNMRVGFYVIELLQAVLINYVLWSHRPDIQQRFIVVALYPIYSDYLRICRVWGGFKCIFYYIPFVAMRMGLFTQEEHLLHAKKQKYDSFNV
mmetsp:Transcript_28004/g.44553  ORF Transcript_28004/g.44553 Transcript_28004/m.44553 type:complete len:137 (+) Transcript_28004:1440-1850(+)